MDLKRLYQNKAYLVLAIGLPLLLLLGSYMSRSFRMVSIFLLFIAICGGFSYIQGMLHLPIDFSPTFFLSIMISIEYGIFYPLLFIPFAGILPSILAGGQVGAGAFLFLGAWMISGIAAKLLLPTVGLLFAGIIAALINLALGWFINSVQGQPVGFFFSVINALMTVFYFYTFGPMIISLIG
jgi:hypothetical protein